MRNRIFTIAAALSSSHAYFNEDKSPYHFPSDCAIDSNEEIDFEFLADIWSGQIEHDLDRYVLKGGDHAHHHYYQSFMYHRYRNDVRQRGSHFPNEKFYFRLYNAYGWRTYDIQTKCGLIGGNLAMAAINGDMDPNLWDLSWYRLWQGGWPLFGQSVVNIYMEIMASDSGILKDFNNSDWSYLYHLGKNRISHAVPYKSWDEAKALFEPVDDNLRRFFLSICEIYEGWRSPQDLTQLHNFYKKHVNSIREQAFGGDPDREDSVKHLLWVVNLATLTWLHNLWKARKTLPPPMILDPTMLTRLTHARPRVTILWCQDFNYNEKLVADINDIVSKNWNGNSNYWISRMVSPASYQPFLGDPCAVSILDTLRTGEGLGRYVLLLSPWLTGMTKSFKDQLGDLLFGNEIQPGAISGGENGTTTIPGNPPIVGFPILSKDEMYWKAQWSRYPTGYESAISDFAVKGDTTSATRLIDVRQIQSSLRDPNVGLNLYSMRSWKSFFTTFDLLAREKNWTTATLVTDGYLKETHYLEKSKWSHAQAHHNEVEMVKFDQQKPQAACLPFHYESVEHMVRHRGIVTPPCFRRQLTTEFKPILDWWKSLNPGNRVVMTGGGNLLKNNFIKKIFGYPFRGGDIHPWEHDIDFHFITTNSSWDMRDFIHSQRFWAVAYGENVAWMLDADKSVGRKASVWHWENEQPVCFESNQEVEKYQLAKLQVVIGLLVNVYYDVVISYYPPEKYAQLEEESMLKMFHGYPVNVSKSCMGRCLDFFKPGQKMIGFTGYGVSFDGNETLIHEGKRSTMGGELPKSITNMARPLQCTADPAWADHNACLPKCEGMFTDCEFSDDFIKFDWWQ